MKSTQRLNYNRFSDALVERGLVSPEVVGHILSQCTGTGTLLTELLVTEDLVSDWELSRVASELYHLPFLPVDIYPPSDEALAGIDPDYLRTYGLVPLDRFGKLLTVAMPSIVPTEVLEGISIQEGGRVLPVVGTVTTNRRWLEEHLPAPAMPTVESAVMQGEDLVASVDLSGDDSWTGIFDAAEEALQIDLQDQVEPEQD